MAERLADVTHRLRFVKGRCQKRGGEMQRVFVAILLTGFAMGCGSSPTAPSTPMMVAGMWSGTASDSSSSMGAGSMMGQAALGTMTWQLTQGGSTVTGSMSFSGMNGGMSGSFSGTISGAEMTFTMDMPMGSMMSSGCSAHSTGAAHVDGTTMTGTYSGSNACTGAFTNGQMTMTRR
jgi:hypothetical protein